MPHAAVSTQQRRRAKSLRQTMTRAETLLWRYFKAHHIQGLGIRRQVPMGDYVADFACHTAGLIIELDGETHDFAAAVDSDARRDAWFKSQGYIVLRFTNDDVLTNLDGVVATVRDAASSGLRSAPPSLSLPHKGGGNPTTRTVRAVSRKRPAEAAR
jgi:very-short-patch-repair endonuclease